MDLDLKKVAAAVVAVLIGLGLYLGWDVAPLQEWLGDNNQPVVEQPVE